MLVRLATIKVPDEAVLGLLEEAADFHDRLRERSEAAQLLTRHPL